MVKKRHFWVGVVSKEHVECGKQGGFAQVCHGKLLPLKKMQPGDILIYYSPQIKFKEQTPCKCFTAIGVIKDKDPYQVTMSEDFMPYRRDVNYLSTEEASILSLIADLNFIHNKKNWGYVFRFGMISITGDDFKIIAKAMQLEDKKINELLF